MADPKIYLAVAFWGESYKRNFLDYCLASLLAPGNIPAITDRGAARLLIATGNPEWQSMQSEPIFIAAQQLIQVEQIPFDASAPGMPAGKMLIVSRAHALLAQRMFADRACGIFLYPDVVLATGYIDGVEALVRQGRKVAMIMSVRFATEKLLAALAQQGIARRGFPLVIGPQQLVRLAIGAMHSEVVRTGFDQTFDDFGAASFFWEVTPGQDLLFHSANWAPAFLDYSALTRHDASTFEQWTLDGDYVARNFADTGEVYVVRDSTEPLMVSFTEEAQVSYALKPHPLYRIPWLRTALKISGAQALLHASGLADPVKRACFRVPVRMRGGEASEEAWRRVERRAAAVTRQIELGIGSRRARFLARFSVRFARLWGRLELLLAPVMGPLRRRFS